MTDGIEVGGGDGVGVGSTLGSAEGSTEGTGDGTQVGVGVGKLLREGIAAGREGAYVGVTVRTRMQFEAPTGDP